MPNDSSTGGYLSPVSSRPVEDDAFEDFIGNVVAGITGLARAMVRPRWQPKPPHPAITINWCAIGITTIVSDYGTVISTTRATCTGITGYQSVMSGTYIKKSATSNINVRIVANLLSNAGVGAGLLRLVLDGVTHPEFVAVNMTTSSNQTSPHGTATFTGRPAGSLAWAFYIGRPDANAWTSVFNPDSTNSTNLPASTRATLSFEEVEP